MTDTFETTLANIISQKSGFESRDEHAVEIGVVLPLLEQIGWNTKNISEIYPQRALPDGRIVDFDLQIDGESRIVIEVKRWGHTLSDEDEGQLANYCRQAGSKLAALTSGRIWRLYLPPTQRGGLRRFLEFDVTTAEPPQTESWFSQFLSRDSMVDFRPSVSAARTLYRESQAYQKFKQSLTKAWGELANDENTLADLVLEFTEHRGIPTSRENVMRFLGSHAPLVNEATTNESNSRKKPASFAIYASPTGSRKKTHQIEGRKGWHRLLIEVCELMRSRHHESYRRNVLSMTDRFAEQEDSIFGTPVGSEGIYARWGSSGEIRESCYQLVTRFGYPRESLVILDSNGEAL